MKVAGTFSLSNWVFSATPREVLRQMPTVFGHFEPEEREHGLQQVVGQRVADGFDRLVGLLEDARHGHGAVVKREMSHKNDESDKGGSDLGSWTFQNVFAESGRLGEQNFLAKPVSNSSGVSQVLSQGFVPLLSWSAERLLRVESRIEEKL